MAIKSDKFATGTFSGEDFLSVTTGADGRYRLEGLRPQRRVSVSAAPVSWRRFYFLTVERPTSKEQAEQILAAAREPFSTAFTVFPETGLCAGELSHLTKADVDFSNNVRPVRGPRGRRAAARHRALIDQVFESGVLRIALKEWLCGT